MARHRPGIARRRALAAALAAVLALLVAGCGRTEEETPVACLDGADAYLSALSAAPGEVLIGGKTPISACLIRGQDGGELASVGEALVEAATRLNAEARAEPGGAANVQLGYLLGAASAAAEDTEGIHADLLRRLTVAARFARGRQPLGERFRAAYREGFDAGAASG